jgi:hypothetical protein
MTKYKDIKIDIKPLDMIVHLKDPNRVYMVTTGEIKYAGRDTPWVEVIRIDKAKGIFEPTGFDLSLLKRRVNEDPVTHKRKRCRSYKLVRMPREEDMLPEETSKQ